VKSRFSFVGINVADETPEQHSAISRNLFIYWSDRISNMGL